MSREWAPGIPRPLKVQHEGWTCQEVWEMEDDEFDAEDQLCPDYYREKCLKAGRCESRYSTCEEAALEQLRCCRRVLIQTYKFIRVRGAPVI